MKKNKFKVLVTDTPDNLIEEKSVLGNNFQLYLTNINSYKKLGNNFKSKVDAILTGANLKFDKKELDNFKNCKVISRYGIGYDKIDLNEAKKRGIKVFVVPDYGVDEVSDHALSLMLALNRSLLIYDYQIKNSYIKNKIVWDYNKSLNQMRLNDITLGIVGLGRIGSSLARKAKALNMNVIFYDPFIPDGYDKVMNIKKVKKLSEIAEKSNIVSLHVPYNEKNHNFINNKFFEKIKKNIIFINVSRGGLVESNVLAKYFNKKISRIGLDVFKKEPPDKNDPIIKLWKKKENQGKIIITPHSAFYSLSAFKELRIKASVNIKQYLLNGRLKNCINK